MSTFLAAFWGGLILSGAAALQEFECKQGFWNLIKPLMFTNAASKSTCLDNAPSLRTLESTKTPFFDPKPVWGGGGGAAKVRARQRSGEGVVRRNDKRVLLESPFLLCPPQRFASR